DHPLHEVLAGQRFDPCLVAMLRLEPGFDAGFDAAFVNDDSPLSWIAKDSSKPGRDGENWVLHATPAWSRANLERDFEDLAVRLADAFRGRFEKPPAIRRAFAHRWRYAQAAEPRDDGLLTVDDQRLAVSGDWLAGSRVEGAWTSGRKAGAWLVDCT
ncbi:MAG: hypothetical protein R3323_09255, partial [Wenzhouxiangellaceae bacterium]|nr:hypothetical protein [Wenzhouxiangellaceae bacterium]